MKKVMLIIIGMVAISLTGLNAKNLPATATKLPAEFKEVIMNEIDYPSFAQENKIEGYVWMKVSVDNDSKLKIIDLSSTQPLLGSHVESELSGLIVTNVDVAEGQIYFLKVAFELMDK